MKRMQNIWNAPSCLWYYDNFTIIGDVNGATNTWKLFANTKVINFGTDDKDGAENVLIKDFEFEHQAKQYQKLIASMIFTCNRSLSYIDHDLVRKYKIDTIIELFVALVSFVVYALIINA
jgi:hypothetical protein